VWTHYDGSFFGLEKNVHQNASTSRCGEYALDDPMRQQ